LWVEVLGDVALRQLPVTPADAADMLGQLRGAALFEGKRGEPKTDLAVLARTIAAIGDAGLSLGPALETLEINPLWVRGDRIEALDALVIATAMKDAVMQASKR
jgi:hypothetical protein